MGGSDGQVALTRAIIIAATAHQGQMSKDGTPYILHPLRVMLAGRTDAERIVGVLHDVVEDTSVTLDDLNAEGFEPVILRGVESMTKRPGEDYEAFIRRCKADPVARNVKLADLADNMDLKRIPMPARKDLERLDRYRRAHAFLQAR